MNTVCPNRTYVVAAILLSILSFHSFGQKTANPDRAKSLKALPSNKKAKVVSYEYLSNYTFDLASEKVSVTNTDVLSLISLEGNVDHVVPVFYNENITLSEAEVKYSNGKNAHHTRVCGNYEVDDIFYSDAKVCTYKLGFLHEGTELVFKSKARYNDPKYLTKVFFHDLVPVGKREITFTIPNSFSVELIERNFDGFDIKKTVTESSSGKTYMYSVNDLRAMRAEPNSLGSLHYYPHIIVATKEYTTRAGKQMVIASVSDLYKWYNSLTKEVNNDPKTFEDEVKKLVSAAKTNEEKIKEIYYWVQDNIKYIAFEDGLAGFRPEAANNVYTNRYGDCKGMANLTKEMLKVAGFDARLTWIGTNRIPYTYEVPSLAVDNHMICTVFINDKQYILDPTEKFGAFGKHAERIQGKEMLIENGETFLLKKVPVADFNANLITRIETLTIDGNKLKGEGEVNFNGEAKTQILYLSAYAKAEDKKRLFDHLAVPNFSNTDQVELKLNPELDREKPFDLKYTYNLTNKISDFENDLYVDLDFNKQFSDLVFDDDRETDYYFNRKVKQKTVKKLKLPPGYKVTHLPNGMNEIHKDFTFSVSFKQTGNEVVYSNEITVTDGLVRKSNFPIWNDYIKRLKDIYNDKIVITKTQ